MEGSNLGDQVRTANSFHHFPRQASMGSEMIDENWDQNLGTEEIPLTVYGSNAIAIPIKDKAHGYTLIPGVFMAAYHSKQLG